jgi:putative endonuclease
MLRGLLERLGLVKRGAVGARGEDAAAAFLKRAGYAILDRNVRVPMGEADIVARDEKAGGTIVLVEVKTRVVDPARPQPKAESQVGAFKRRKLLAILSHLVKANGWQRVKKRIDIVAVEYSAADMDAAPTVRHLVNAVKP